MGFVVGEEVDGGLGRGSRRHCMPPTTVALVSSRTAADDGDSV